MAVVKLGKPVKSNLGGPNGAMAYIIDPAKTDGGRLVSSNYERTPTRWLIQGSKTTRTHPKASKRTAVWRTTSS